jgi:hypothetical protein
VTWQQLTATWTPCASSVPTAVRPETVAYNAVLSYTNAPVTGESHIMHYLLQPGALPGADGASLLLNIAGAKGKLRLARWRRVAVGSVVPGSGALDCGATCVGNIRGV